MTQKLNNRMQFLLDRLTIDRVRPKDRFKYIKTKEFKAKCKVYKYRFSERDIKTLYRLNCFPSLQSETETELEVVVNTSDPIITIYHVPKSLEVSIQPAITQVNPLTSQEITPKTPLINTFKVQESTLESTPKSFLEFNPNIYTLCGIYLTVIVAILYFFYVVFIDVN